jgi:group I intron endonuclease
MVGIYMWFNLVNGKVYVGSSSNVPRRKSHHISKLKVGKHHNAHLQAAWNKYGQANFDFIVIEVVEDLLWLRAREHAWILRLQAANRKLGYNTSEDAWAVTSNETKAKLRQAWIARKARGDYYKFTPADTQKGTTAAGKKNTTRWQDPQTRAEMQKAQSAGWTPEHRAIQAERFKQQKLDDPTLLRRGGLCGAAVRWNKEA